MSVKLTPPVGTPVPSKVDVGPHHIWVNAREHTFLASGTAALSCALLCAKHIKPEKTDVLLPAYGCPDLIAAVEYAGLTPVLVDISLVPFGYNPESLSECLSSSTLAIVNTTLLGIRMETAALLNCTEKDIILIEDNAQWFPEPKDQTSSEKKIALFDQSFDNFDLSIVSFGRGKPVNLMGGGAVFAHSERAAQALCTVQKSADQNLTIESSSNTLSIPYRFKSHVFEALCNAWLYGIVTKLPFLSIGETVFHSLDKVEPISPDALNLLPTAITRYIAQQRQTEFRFRNSDIASPFVAQSQNRLLRFPVFFSHRKVRDAAIKVLEEHGIGASPFYGAVLSEIPGVQSNLKSMASYPGAQKFADNMMTLPTHIRITDELSEITLNLCRDYQPVTQADFFES